MSLGTHLNALEFGLHQQLRELKTELLQLSAETERPGVDHPLYHALTDRLGLHLQRLGRVQRELRHIEGQLAGRQQLVKGMHRGSDARWRANQSIQTHDHRRRELIGLLAELTAKLREIEQLGRAPTFLNVMQGVQTLGDEFTKIIDNFSKKADTHVAVDTQWAKHQISALRPAEPADVPLSLWLMMLTMLIRLVQIQREHRRN